MHHKTKEAAIKKYSEAGYESIPVLLQTIKSENEDFNDDDVSAVIEGILAKKYAKTDNRPAGAIAEAIHEAMPNSDMLRFDMWRGDLVVLKQKKNQATGQTYVTKMQFQFTDSKPKKSISVTQKQADFWNETHFTARFQSTEFLFPAGVKQDWFFDLDEDENKWNKTVKELQTA